MNQKKYGRCRPDSPQGLRLGLPPHSRVAALGQTRAPRARVKGKRLSQSGGLNEKSDFLAADTCLLPGCRQCLKVSLPISYHYHTYILPLPQNQQQNMNICNWQLEILVTTEVIEAAGQNYGWNISLDCQPAISSDLNMLDLGFYSDTQSIQHTMAPTIVDELIQCVEDAYWQQQPTANTNNKNVTEVHGEYYAGQRMQSVPATTHRKSPNQKELRRNYESPVVLRGVSIQVLQQRSCTLKLNVNQSVVSLNIK